MEHQRNIDGRDSDEITTEVEELARYIGALSLGPDDQSSGPQQEEIMTTPLFSWSVLKSTRVAARLQPRRDIEAKSALVQYGLLGTESRKLQQSTVDPIFLNINAPWSAFICGSQGSGKSHTLACMLESCLLPRPEIGKLPKPLPVVVFNYGVHSAGAVCEAAYLCSAGISVNVLVSPSNLFEMEKAYAAIPGSAKKLRVMPLKLRGTHLNASRMLKLMAFNDKDGGGPLYLEVSLPNCILLRCLVLMLIYNGISPGHCSNPSRDGCGVPRRINF